MDSKRLREERHRITGEMRHMIDALEEANVARKGKNEPEMDFSAEEDERFKRLHVESESLTKQIERAEAITRLESVHEEEQRPTGNRNVGRTPIQRPSARPTGEQHALACAAWMRFQSGFEPSEEEQEAADLTGVNLHSKWFDVTRPSSMKLNQHWHGMGNIGATMSGIDPTKGGYLKDPGSLVRSLELALLQFGGVRQVAQIITTSDGNPMAWPTANDTANTGRILGESATQTTTTTANATYAAHILNAYLYTSDFVLVPFTLMMDAAFDIAQLLGSMLGERVGRITNTHFTTGDGAAKPQGIVTGATLGVTTASTTAIAADELFDLVHSVDPAYRGMGCGWMFHDSVLLALRKLKDGNGRYLWEDSIQVGEPNMLLGFPYTINQDMAGTIQAAAKTALFGRLSDYKVRDVGGIRLRRVDELFAVNDQVGFAYLMRCDGKLIDAGTHPVRYLLQHA